jgi:exopolysaccharide production protein ExoZ
MRGASDEAIAAEPTMTALVPAHNPSILSIQVMRGIAALMVAASHTGSIMMHPENGGLRAFPWAETGWIGVTFFFVLSGFIIAFAHARDIGHPQRLARYAWRRFSRLYPVYWIFLALYVIVALSGIGPVNFSTAPGHVLTAITLVQWVEAPLIPLRVAWTLIYEVFFYAMFAVLILNRKVGVVVFAIWGGAILVDTLVLGTNRMGPLGMWNVHFLMGIACCALYRRAAPGMGLPLLAIGIAALVALYAAGMIYARPDLQQAQPMALLLLGVPFAMILVGATMAERDHGFAPPRLALLLGDASYAIYLVHSAAISAMARIQFKLFGPLFPAPLVFILIFVGSVTAGVLCHLWVERPVLALSRRFLTKRHSSQGISGD